ncbi:AAA domain-containing protein, putative AbiEii toxin, Type IV TA system [Pseudomonas simiae]|uniref:AAA family ATPase n=1 Tax=Pseudomonas simiae TaxID=321846 RepID=UPI00084DB223|nr:AAA family ATPase [Pseudomonas simiae]SFB54309.1 AAA domain-containing protein, putative AbiEii toxin, Type IV TA system [Pseudomonas simiae]
MARISYFEHDGHFVDLIKPSQIGDDENVFTVIVGKNGVGKSRLLADIAKTASFEYAYLYDSSGTGLTYSSRNGPDDDSKVIAISTSPFDKFPSQKRKLGADVRSNYRYVGMRGEGMYQPSSAVSLIASASKGLIDKLLARAGYHNLLAVFDSLNFYPVVDFVFKPGYIRSGKDYDEYDVSRVIDTSLAIDLKCMEGDYGIQIDERYFQVLQDLPVSKRHEAFNAIRKVHQLFTKRKAIELTVNFSGGSASLDGRAANDTYIEAMLVLVNAGLMRLIDLKLKKIGYGEMSLKRASSGEQCLMVLMLGIAGHITDGSIILIDEPEISLHPRWQEQFMMLLTTSFSAYKRCHFIVATHSPQIISRLRDRACFVTSLSKNEVYHAEEFYHRSADYQLAELFDAPGMMNEYISRLAFNLLAKVKASRSVDSRSAEDLFRLKELGRQVESDDPVKELIISVAELCDKYANN